MIRILEELAVIIVCAAFIGVPIGLWLTGVMP
jgi:hypothetical protein